MKFSTSSRLDACTTCADKPCLTYSREELMDTPYTFLVDPNPKVCVTDAISVTGKDGIPVISDNKCIQCGICVQRCPFDVIQMIAESPPVIGGEGERHRNIPLLSVTEQESHAYSFGQAITRCEDEDKELLVRNLMLSMGHSIVLSRTGGTTRITGVSRDLNGHIFVIRTNWGNPDPEHVRRLAFDDMVSFVASVADIDIATLWGLLITEQMPSRDASAPVQIATALEKWPPYHELLSIEIKHLAQLMWAGAWITGHEDDFKLTQIDAEHRKQTIRTILEAHT